MNKIPACVCVLSVTTLGAVLPAQNLVSYRPNNGAPAQMFEFPCASRAWVGGGPGLIAGAYPGRARPLQPHPLGAVANDSTAGVLFTTNGQVSIQRTEYPRIGSASGVALPDLPIPAGVGTVNGMAVDPALRRIFLTNGVTVFECDPLAGMAILVSFPAAPLNVLAGLDFDPTQPGLLFAVSTAGEVATYGRAGGLIAVSAPTYAWPGAMATGVALDKSDAAGGVFYVQHANGQVYNHTTGALHTTEPADQVGISYIPSPIQLPSAGVCGGAAPTVTVSELVVDGLANGLELRGLAAGTPFVVWGIVVLPPGSPPAVATGVPFACGDTLWLLPPMPTPVTLLAPVGGTSSLLPLAVPAGLAGWALFVQPLVPCAASPCGFVLPNAMQLEISRG